MELGARRGLGIAYSLPGKTIGERMGIIASLIVYSKSILVPKKKRRVSHGGYNFVLKQPRMGERLDVSEASGMKELIPATTEIIDGFVFFKSDEYLAETLRKGKEILPVYLDKSLANEFMNVSLVSGLTIGALKRLPMATYAYLLNEVEQFTDSEISEAMAKKNSGIWSSARAGLVEARRDYTTRSSMKGTTNTTSATSGPTGKSADKSR